MKIVNQTEAKCLLQAVAPANVLLLGPPGCGKSTLGMAYLSRFGRVLVLTGTQADGMIGAIARCAAVLVDEAHRMRTIEGLYPILDASLSGQQAPVVAMTTTDEGNLPAALRSRLITVALSPYTPEHLAQIAALAAPALPASVLAQVAELSRGSPRRAKVLARLLDGLRRQEILVSTENVAQLLAQLGYPAGLSQRQLALVRALEGKTRSLSTLAGMMGTGNDTVKIVEAELIQMGLTTITGRGRALTAEGERILATLS